jgi:hypothetical protein
MERNHIASIFIIVCATALCQSTFANPGDDPVAILQNYLSTHLLTRGSSTYAYNPNRGLIEFKLENPKFHPMVVSEADRLN